MLLNPIPHNISPFRITGGKSRVLPPLHAQLPTEFDEYREGFLGGGSMALSVMWRNKNAKYWLNEGNPKTHAFWKNLHECPAKMQEWIWQKKAEHCTEADAENLYHWCRANIDAADPFEVGCMWFIVNRMSYNGDGVFMDTSHFTDESISKLKCCGDLLASVDLTISSYDYSVLLSSSTKNTFVFLDPPYSLGSKY